MKTIEINDNTNIIFFEYVNGKNDKSNELSNQASNPYSKYDIIINTDCKILNKIEEKLKLEIIDLTSEK